MFSCPVPKLCCAKSAAMHIMQERHPLPRSHQVSVVIISISSSGGGGSTSSTPVITNTRWRHDRVDCGPCVTANCLENRNRSATIESRKTLYRLMSKAKENPLDSRYEISRNPNNR